MKKLLIISALICSTNMLAHPIDEGDSWIRKLNELQNKNELLRAEIAKREQALKELNAAIKADCQDKKEINERRDRFAAQYDTLFNTSLFLEKKLKSLDSEIDTANEAKAITVEVFTRCILPYTDVKNGTLEQRSAGAIISCAREYQNPLLNVAIVKYCQQRGLKTPKIDGR